MAQEATVTVETIDEIINLLKDIREGLVELKSFVPKVKEEKPDELYTCKRAARFLKKDPATISRMIADGRLTKVEVGGSSGILKSELTKVKRHENR